MIEIIKTYFLTFFYFILVLPRFFFALALLVAPYWLVTFAIDYLFQTSVGAITLILWMYLFFKMQEEDHWYPRLIHKVAPFL